MEDVGCFYSSLLYCPELGTLSEHSTYTLLIYISGEPSSRYLPVYSALGLQVHTAMLVFFVFFFKSTGHSNSGTHDWAVSMFNH